MFGRRYLAFALVAGIALAGAAPPHVTITRPRPDDIPIGPTALEAAVDGLEPGDEVELFADGRKLARLSAPPFRVAWDAGDLPKAHALSVVVQRGGGEIASARLRTPAVGFTANVSTRSVGISPVVVDRSGRFVKGLEKSDFSVKDNGTPQQIETFDAGDSPLALVIAFDVSGSMTLKMRDARAAALRLVDALKPQDEVCLLTFNSVVVGSVPFTKDRAAIRTALEETRPSGETALYDATATALKRLRPMRGRKAVVLFTDGEDNQSRLSVDQVIEMARASEASILSVAQGKNAGKILRVYLDRLADETGGRSFFVGDVNRLPGVFDDIVAELKSQYFLTYTPKALVANSWHDVEVTVRRPDVVVRAKKSYRVQ